MKKLSYSVNKAHTLVLSTIIIIGLIVTAIGCSTDIKPIETEADITGFITEIHQSLEEGLHSQIDVESNADNNVTNYAITIKEDTLIFQKGINLNRVSFAAFEVNQWVKIWLSGPVMDKQWPIHATAQQVIIDALKPYQDS